VKACLGRSFSFSMFCAAQVATDLEPGYFLWRHRYPVHRWAHTYVGAVGVGILTALVATPLLRAIGRRWRASADLPFRRWLVADTLSWRTAILSALIGTLSHVWLDSIMHGDARPLRPFTDANVMLGLVSVPTLHVLCVGAGIVSLLYLRFTRPRGPAPGEVKE